MRRFFVENTDTKNSSLWLSSEESRHAVKVLRISEGETVLIFDNKGDEYEAKISKIQSKEKVQIQLIKKKPREEENLKLRVAQGFLQKQKMDWIVEKACEIGVKQLIPLETEFSMVHPGQDSFEKIKSRWERISIEAAKQSGNVRTVEIGALQKFETFIKNLPDSELKFIFHPYQADFSLKDSLAEVEARTGKKPFDVLLLIGPEGGFSEDEVQLARSKGIKTVSLGKNILRAETAFIVLSGIFKILN